MPFSQNLNPFFMYNHRAAGVHMDRISDVVYE
jgi:hypothetical protein